MSSERVVPTEVDARCGSVVDLDEVIWNDEFGGGLYFSAQPFDADCGALEDASIERGWVSRE